MDYKAIEAALVALAEMRVEHDADPDDIERGIVLTYAECQVLRRDGPDILRIVRAMAWMEEQGPTVRDSRGVAAVEVYRDGCKETYFGPTIIEAIEAAMADQQTKGATDEA